MFALAHLPALRFVERRPQIAAWRRATRPHISKISIPSVRPMVRAVEGTVDGSGRDILHIRKTQVQARERPRRKEVSHGRQGHAEVDGESLAESRSRLAHRTLFTHLKQHPI